MNMPATKSEERQVTDNHPKGRAAKIEIRRNVLNNLKCDAHVFDAFAGTGQLYRRVWLDAASYVGCDKRYFSDGRKVFVADNRRVLRAVDLTAFNVFDLDAYGTPWEQAAIIATRRPIAPGERVGMILTEAGLSYKLNTVPKVTTALIGLRPPVVGLLNRREEIHARLLAELARRMGGTIERRWQSVHRQAPFVAYIAVIFKGPKK